VDEYIAEGDHLDDAMGAAVGDQPTSGSGGRAVVHEDGVRVGVDDAHEISLRLRLAFPRGRDGKQGRNYGIRPFLIFRNFMSTPPLNDEQIEALLSEPTPGAIATVRALEGDFMVLGVGGKMGTTTALMLRRALDAAGKRDVNVYGVSRFSRPEAAEALRRGGVEPIACDLADAAQVARLPRVANVEYLAGQKFGTDSAPGETWIQNTIVPSLVAEHFKASRIVVFSTGCVYPFVPVDGPGANETTPVAFLGEYASTCVGRERVFGHFAQKHGTRQLMYRLNYAVELRYGVLVDVGTAVLRGAPVDITMGAFNLIWQGDACARAIQCLAHTANPPKILNITGAEKISIRAVAEKFGVIFGKAPVLKGTPAKEAWLADASESIRLFGPPTKTLDELIALVAAHVSAGGRLLGKPTHFEARDGKF
jgi:nucleoside-diphosphate-sugar epimerase